MTYAVPPHHDYWWVAAVAAALAGGMLLAVWAVREWRRAGLLQTTLEESRSLAAHAARMAQFGYWTLNFGTNKVLLTAETSALFGWPPEPRELYGEWIRALIHPDDWPRLGKAVEACRKGEPQIDTEVRVIRTDGLTRHVRLLGERHAGKDGGDLCVGCMQDMTALVMARDALRGSTDRYREILESISEGYFEVDTRGRFTFSNSAIQRMLGYKAAELLLLDYRGQFSKEDAKEILRVFSDAARTREPGLYSGRVRRRDGEELFIEASVLPVAGGEDLITGFRVVVRDVTWRVREEERRRGQERQMWSARKMESLSVLAGGVAHEFNNILTGILGYAELAEMTPGCDREALGHLAHIKESAERAGRLARQMLAYSGRGSFAVGRVFLDTFVTEMTRPLLAQLPEKARLRVEWGDETPPIEADRTQLSQLLLNLVLNAAEAYGDAGGEILVRTGAMDWPAAMTEETPLRSAMEPGRHACLEVLDNGPGMDHDTLERIFDPFFTTKFTGRGLGLSAVLGIVRGHHGGIWVESAPGRGTTVRVCLPACDTEPAGEPGGPTAFSPEAERVSLGRVLLAEDEKEVRCLGSEMLGLLGFEVDAVADGRAAVARFKDNPDGYHCVVLDWMMPRMNGDEAVAAMRALRGDQPAVITSGYTEEEALRRIADAGNVVFVQKPYSMAGLAEAIRRACGSGKK